MSKQELDFESSAHLLRDHEQYRNQRQSREKARDWSKYLVFALSVSVLLNIYQAMAPLRAKPDTSKHAKLSFNKSSIYEHHNAYTDYNETVSDEVWSDISIDLGVIALPDSEAAASDLPTSQRFPWDHTKGIYVISAYHSLHCIKIIHNVFYDFTHSLPPRRDLKHVAHCIDALRQDIICQADDTPLYTTTSTSPDTGVGQARMCRDWKQLERWAEERTGCFRYVDPLNKELPWVERHKFCPEGSSYVVQ